MIVPNGALLLGVGVFYVAQLTQAQQKFLRFGNPQPIQNVICRKVLLCTRLVMYTLGVSRVLYELLVSSNMVLRAGSQP